MVKMQAEADNISQEELVLGGLNLFVEPALSWFVNKRSEGVRSWSVIEQSLKEEILGEDYDYWLEKKIDSRIQREDEKFLMFKAELEIMYRSFRCLPVNPEKHLLQTLMRNTKRSILRRLNMNDLASLQTLTKACLFYENMAQNETRLRKMEQHQRRGVFALSESENSADEEENEEIAAIRGKFRNRERRREFKDKDENNKDYKEVECWNCKGKGHFFRDCKEKIQQFCYRCGNPGVIVANCLKCQSKNQEN
jgi:hypothetical protein